MAGICETSNDLQCWSHIRKLLKVGFINNSTQFEQEILQ